MPQSSRSRACHQFQQVTIRAVEVNAPATLSGVQLAVYRVPGITSPSDAGFLHALEDRVELVIAHVKGIMMRLKGLGVVKVEGQFLVDAHGGEMSHRSCVIKPENLGEEFCRRFFVLRRYDRVI